MAHNLNFKKSNASFFSVRELAWHKLGRVLDNPPTSEEAIKFAQLDYEVVKLKNHVFSEDGSNVLECDNSYSTVRTDENTILGENLSSKYTVVQNTKAFKVFDDIVGSKQAIFETAGALGKGEIIFITAKLPSYIKMPNKEDIVDKYLLLTNSHDGTSSLTIMLTPIRVVCNNTLSLALKGKTDHKIYLRHDGTINNKLNDAITLLNLINTRFDSMQEAFNHMATIKVNDDIVERLAAEVLLNEKQYMFANTGKLLLSADISSKAENAFDLAINTIHGGAGQDMYEGTGLWLFNGFTNYFQNTKSYTSDDKMMDSMYFGNTIDKISYVGQQILSLV